MSVHADDASLVRIAAGMAFNRLRQRLHALLSPFLVSDAQAFAEQLHPIFMVADRPGHHRVLEEVGCNAQDVVAAVSRLLQAGSARAAKVCLSPLCYVKSSAAFKFCCRLCTLTSC